MLAGIYNVLFVNEGMRFNWNHILYTFSSNRHSGKADVGTIGYLHPYMAACKTGSKFFDIYK